MFKSLPRRKRLIANTSILATLFVLLSAFFFWFMLKPEPAYRPGEKIEGLTTQLARTLPTDHPTVTFTDVTRTAGIGFEHFYGRRSSQLPEDMGSGAAWGDYDNDGWLDLFVVNEIGPLTMGEDEIKKSPAHCELYHNNGDGSFEAVTHAAGVDLRGWGMSATWCDYNNDGWVDLMVTSYGGTAFFKNNGDGTFRDITKTAGLDAGPGYWAGAAWADFNRDGFLDVYVAGYVKYTAEDANKLTSQYDAEVPASINPSSFVPERNRLFHNNGDGTFREMAEEAGVTGHNGRSLSAVWCDFDEDGWPDLYIANDVSDNAFFRNLGNETFRDISHEAWVADYRGAMGIAVGDWDADQDMDIFITHWMAQENALYSNRLSQLSASGSSIKTIRFVDEADHQGLGQIALDYIGWGSCFFDYDNDGWLDLFVVNGSTFQEKDKPYLLIPMADQLFWNRGANSGFYDVSLVSGDYFNKKYVGRGAAFADYDNDGDTDIFLVNNGGPAVLLRNDGGNRNNWLKVELEGKLSNRQAIGTRLRLVAGGRAQIRQVGSQSPYLSQNSLVELFGLGDIARVDSLEIIWPSKVRQLLLGLSANQTVRIKEQTSDTLR